MASIEASLLSVAEARLEEKDLVERLLQLYLYDMAGFTGDRVDADSGRYPYDYFEQYWTDEDRTPYLFRLDGQPAGFCFVNRWTLVYDPPDSALSIAEFFVMREARRGGLGREGALRIIRARPGDWEIRVLAENTGASEFWQRVADDLRESDAQAALIQSDDERWQGMVWKLHVPATT